MGGVMKPNDINPHIRYARVHSFPSVNQYYSRCYDCRLFFFTKADGCMTVDGEKYNISNNTVIYLPPSSRYRFHFNAGDEYEAIVINFDLCQRFSHFKESLTTATDANFIEEKVVRYELPESFASPIIRIRSIGSTLLKQCVDEFMTKRELYRECSAALLKLYLTELLRDEATGGHSELVRGVIEFIKENYADSTLTNDEIAKCFGYHPYHISKLMRSATGMPLKQYLLYYRVQIAKGLLIKGNAEVEEVAWKSGFGSSSYFIKIFRESTGLTPKKYRDSHKSEII